MTPGTCDKTMTVNDSAQGCSRIYPYRGATLSDDMSSTTAFDASFRCGSRNAATVGDNKAYRIQVGTGTPAFLTYDKSISDLFYGISIGPVSTQTQNYNFSSTTDVTCDVKVGDGYSTNASCQLTGCVGSQCANPETFIVVPSEENTCTNSATVKYDVGCNPSSENYLSCLQLLYEDSNPGSKVFLSVNGASQQASGLVCTTTTPPGALGPVKECTIQLPSG